jgi:iron complex outermembrane recepter protein
MINKTNMSGASLFALGLAASLFSALPSAVLAQAAATATPPKAEEVVIVTGTRRAARSAADTPAPVDVIGAGEIAAQADTDTANLIRNVVPSFNVNVQAISDAATIIRPANLRGLAPDHTLVLINGKRRHRAAVIAFIGGGVSDGAQGVDLSTIPSIALKQVEVLRDGAAAQYGSDAIAGVMNFILRTDPDSFEVEAKAGQFYEGDGTTYQVAANFGVGLGEDGFANLSMEWRESDPTVRSNQRPNAAALTAAGYPDIPNPAQIWGQPEVRGDFKTFLNAGYDMGEGRSVYAFGSYATRSAEGGFNYRNPNTRGGVYVNGANRLVLDTTPNGTGNCPTLALPNLSNPAQVAADRAALTALRNNPNCFVFNEILPGGFLPFLKGTLQDVGGSFGMRGAVGKLNYDVSVTAGKDTIEFILRDTLNASLGPDSPTVFRAGSQAQFETTINLDFDYAVPVKGFASDLNIAAGFELRQETFELFAGEENSYIQGRYYLQGASIGSNGFNGFRASDAGRSTRKNNAIYVDMEADVTENLVLGLAVRSEDYDTFGRTTNYKVSGLLRASDALTLRSTYSTGFRAPTPGQATIVNTTTSIVNGQLTNTGTIPPTSILGKLYGGVPLGPEESKNFSIGAGLQIGRLKTTLDFFNIKLTDRIRLKAGRLLTAAELAALTTEQRNAIRSFGGINANGTISADFGGGFRFFVNGVDTTTQGVDFVASYPLDLFGGRTNLSLAANYTENQIDRGKDLVGDPGVRQIEEGLPKFRGNIGITHAIGKWNFSGRINYFGEYYEAFQDDPDSPINGDAQVTVDAEGTFALTDNVSISLGAENLLNSYPTDNPYGSGALYAVTAPAGFNGGFYYLKLSYKR